MRSASCDQIQTRPRSCSPFETPVRERQCSFLLASSHHHPHMNFYYIFLLLLVVLSAYSESPQHGKPPDSLDSTVVAVCPNSSFDSLGVLAPVLPQSEMFRTVLPLNEVGSVLQNGVFKFILPQNGVSRNKSVLPQSSIVTSNCQLFKNRQNSVNSLSNIGDKIMKLLTSIVIHCAKKLAQTIGIS